MSSLLSNFDIAQQALKTSLESTGSAMAEHAKWSDSIEARLLKLQAAWQSFAQTFMSSDLLKGGITLLTGVVDVLDKLVDKLGLLGTISLGTGIFSLFKMKGTGTWSFITNELSLFTELASEAWSSGGKLSTRIKNVGAAASATGGNIAGKLTGSLVGFIGTAAAVTTAVALVYNAMKNAAEAASQARQDTIKASDDFLDASNSFEIAYAKYSGKTNLTSEEEAELENAINGTVDALNDKSSALQNAVNSSNDYVASLEAIAKEEREAAATMAKEKRIAAEKELEYINKGLTTFDGSEVNVAFSLNDSEEAINIAKDIGKDYYTRTPSGAGRYRDGFQLSANASADEIVKYYDMLVEYQAKLADSGLEDTKAYDNTTTAINKLTDAVGVYVDGVYDAAKAQYQLDNGIPKTLEEYLKMRETILSSDDIKGKSFDTKKTIAGTLDSEYSQVFDLSSVEAQARSLIGIIDKYDDADADKMETFLNMRTAVNNNDCPVGEYISQFDKIKEITKDWTDAEKEEFNLTFGIDTDRVKTQYDEMLKTISRGMGETEAKKFLDGLTASELSAAFSLKGEVDWEGGNPKEILAQIKEEAKVLEAMNFTIAIDVEAESIEALNAAMSESVSATGLSSESIAALKGRYAELASQGYDLSAMFEETSNGIHLNRNAVSELEKAYASDKLSETRNKLGTLKDRYDELTDEIKNCTDAGRRADLYTEQQNIQQKINDLATLAAQYEGLTSAYNDWQRAESAGSERDMYENIISGFETVEDEISRGWYDDGTIEFLELLTGKDLSTSGIDEVKKAWKSVGETIKGTDYSIRDFFTTNEDGESTNTGVYNFLRAVEDVTGDKDVIKRDENNKIIGFDFQVFGGDEAIAEALGVSEELVQIMLRAADDAGFVVTLDGEWTQFADLKTHAEESNNALKKLKSEGLEELKGFSDEDLNFNFAADNAESLQTELEKANNVLEKFKKNGKVDLEMEGAQEALDVAEYFTIALDKLSEPVYMQLETNQVEEDLRNPLEKMQEFERLVKKKHLLTLSGDTEELQETEEEMNKIVEELDKLDKKTKIKLGIEGLTTEEIKDKLEKGEIEIPATVDIQLEMSDDLKDMRLMMMRELGLATDEEVKLKIGYEIEDSLVDKLTDEEKKIVVKYIEENPEAWDKLSDEEKEIFIDLIASGVDLETLTNEETKKVVIDFIAKNEDEFDKLTDEEQQVVVDLITDDSALEALENHQVEIEAFARIFGVEKVDDLKKKLDSLTDEEITILTKVLGQIDVEKLKTTVSGLDDKTVQAIAEAIGKGDVEGLKTIIGGLDDKTVQAIAEAFGYSDVDELNNAIDNLDPKVVQAIAQALGITDVNSLREAINRLTGKDVDAVANVDGKDDVDSLKNSIDNLKGKTITVWADIKKKASDLWDKLTGGGGGVDGTAHVNGTAFSGGTVVKSGKAYKQGNWGTKDSGVALMGEEAPELLVRNGRWHLVGEKGAGFYGYKKGDIIFNAEQTKQIFEKGKITHGNGRGKSLATGTAFSSGTGGDTEIVVGTNKVTGNKYTKDSSSDSKDTEETLDWIETKLARIQRAIDKLDQKASNVYKSWSSRNSALKSEITEVRKEISAQQSAYDKYMQAAAGVGLSSSWVNKIKNGAIDIDTITDEALKEKISDYKEFYEKALECKDAIEELKEAESALYKQRFDNVSTQYEGILSVVEHEKNMLEEYISQSEASGYLISANYYKALQSNEKENISKLKKEKSALLSELETAMKSGTITKNSEAWVEMVNKIDETTLAIEQSNTALKEYQTTLQQLSWETFDLLQDKISSVTEEADFLIELLSSDKLHDDKGQLTDEGMSAAGLHGQNYNSYMYQADKAAQEAARLKKELSKDPYDTELEARYREMISLQQEYILAAEQEKEAIRDLVEEGLEIELDYLDELIQKKNDALNAEKELYEFNKKVEEQQQNIASLRKQLTTYEGDTSEEAQQRIQEIKLSLKEAEEDLETTQYDQWISETGSLLDSLYLEYETILNTRMDNLDALIADMIYQINSDSIIIGDTIRDTANNVGYTLSDSMQSIWNNSTASTNGVLTVYGDKLISSGDKIISTFTSSHSTTIGALNTINTNLQSMITQLNKIASTKVESAANSSAANTPQANAKPSTPSTPTTSTPTYTPTYNNSSSSSSSGAIKVGGKINAGSAKIYSHIGAKGEGQYYRKDPIYTVLQTNGNWIQVRYHRLSSGVTGWFKKGDVKAYAKGKKNFLSDEVAWTQENGGEMIIRPSDGAILTPIAKGDSVLTSAASGNIWNMANNPEEFIKNNLNLGSSNVPNNSSSQNNIVQNIEHISFNMPNVKNYDDILYALKSDRRFEKLVAAMTIDRINGGSSLAKNKSIR